MLYMFLADGFEETEAIAALDFIRRADIPITTVGMSKTVTGAHQLKVIPDITIEEAQYEGLSGIILPGGMPGAKNLYENLAVRGFLYYAVENHLLIAAICAAPGILGKLGLLKDKKAVCFPGFEQELVGAEVGRGRTEVCENIITAKGMGAVIEFAALIVEYLKDKDTADAVKDSIFYE